MQDFDYNFIKNEYNNKAEMLLTDNDIFMKTSTNIKSYLTSVTTKEFQNITVT